MASSAASVSKDMVTGMPQVRVVGDWQSSMRVTQEWGVLQDSTEVRDKYLSPAPEEQKRR